MRRKKETPDKNAFTLDKVIKPCDIAREALKRERERI